MRPDPRHGGLFVAWRRHSTHVMEVRTTSTVLLAVHATAHPALASRCPLIEFSAHIRGREVQCLT